MAELAREIPGGFGGWFGGRIDGIGAADKINVYLLRLDERSAAFDALAARAELARNPYRNGIDGRKPENYHALQGDFDFLQLMSCKAALSAGGVFDVPEVHGLGIDERRNRIHVEVEEGGVKKVRAKAREIAVPVRMILIEVGEPAVLVYGSPGRFSGSPM